MAKLYELNKAIEDFEFEIDKETGEILNMDALDQLELERDAKIENIALWVKNLKADVEAYKREKESFARKQSMAQNKIDRLSSYLQFSLNGEKYDSEDGRVTIRYRQSKSVEIDDESIIPQQFLKEQPPKIDKMALKEQLKAGVLVAGAHLEEKQNIQIK